MQVTIAYDGSDGAARAIAAAAQLFPGAATNVVVVPDPTPAAVPAEALARITTAIEQHARSLVDAGVDAALAAGLSAEGVVTPPRAPVWAAVAGRRRGSGRAGVRQPRPRRIRPRDARLDLRLAAAPRHRPAADRARRRAGGRAGGADLRRLRCRGQRDRGRGAAAGRAAGGRRPRLGVAVPAHADRARAGRRLGTRRHGRGPRDLARRRGRRRHRRGRRARALRGLGRARRDRRLRRRRLAHRRPVRGRRSTPR